MDDGENVPVSEESFSLYILKSSPGSMVQAETFLKNRGWKVASGTDLRSALGYIIQNQPQYVMITVDHKNKKVKALPKLLVQAFPVKIIAFAEHQENMSVRALHEMNMEYSLFPPVSGPAIDRMVRKIKKDEETGGSSQDGQRNFSAGDNKNSDNQSMSFSGGSFENARAALNQLVGGDSDSGDSSSAIHTGGSGLVQSGSGTYVDKGTASKMHNHMGEQSSHDSSHYNPQTGQNSQDLSRPLEHESFDEWSERMRKMAEQQSAAAQRQIPTIDHANYDRLNKQKLQKAGGAAGAGHHNPQVGEAAPDPAEPLDGESFDQWSERMQKMAQQQSEGQSPAPVSLDLSTFDKLKKNLEMDTGTMTPEQRQAYKNNSQSQGRNKKEAPVMESDYVPKKVRKVPEYKHGGYKRGSEDSIIVRGTQQALDETVELTDENAVVQAVEKTSNVACITVESPRFSGYLVCALGKNRKIDKKMIDVIQKKLFSFLKSNGEELSNEDTMNVKLKEIEFEDWAVSQAEFLRKSIHNGEEIAMAFFPTKDINQKLEESASEKMLKMELKDIKADTALEFDLYVYMPENNKYILYTPQGMVFYGNQKDRLQEKGVAHIHLRKDSVHNVRKYKAQNYLNDKINEYKTQIANQKAS